MIITENLKVGLQSIKANKLRSILTALIIAIGITALVGILTGIRGIEKKLTEDFSTMGANSFTIQNRGINIRVGRSGSRPKNFPPIRYEQAMDFKERYKYSDVVSVSDNLSSGATAKYKAEKSDPNVRLLGGDENWSIASGYSLAMGRNFSPNEMRYASNVILIGSALKDLLFKDENPVDKIITVGLNKFKVIGVFKEKGEAMIGPGDRFGLIPISRAKQLEGSETTSYTITVMAGSPQILEAAIGEAKAMLRNIRKLNIRDEDNFEITKSDAFATQLIQNLKEINYATIAIGAITLFGAAIALMNIMLVSVTERTREIGIRKSIGATPLIIRRQFLIEAIIICIMGGIGGIILGISVGNVVSIVIGGSFVIPWAAILLGISLCILVGITSGIYPAVKASRLDPVDALRYE